MRLCPVLKLLNRNGDKISEWPVTARAGGGHEAEVPLSGVPPGDYLIEIASSADSSAAKTLVALQSHQAEVRWLSCRSVVRAPPSQSSTMRVW